MIKYFINFFKPGLLKNNAKKIHFKFVNKLIFKNFLENEQQQLANAYELASYECASVVNCATQTLNLNNSMMTSFPPTTNQSWFLNNNSTTQNNNLTNKKTTKKRTKISKTNRVETTSKCKEEKDHLNVIPNLASQSEKMPIVCQWVMVKF